MSATGTAAAVHAAPIDAACASGPNMTLPRKPPANELRDESDSMTERRSPGTAAL